MGPNKLRYFLAKIVSEDADLSDISKKQIIRFFENADLHQLKAFALDGEIVASINLDEDARKFIDDRFANEAYAGMISRPKRNCRKMFKNDPEKLKDCIDNLKRK